MADLLDEALARFQDLLDRAASSHVREPTAVSLATADERGRPSCRTVLLKGVDRRGFVIYTNRGSRKGRQLIANPRAALCFFWQTLFEQALVDGDVEGVSDAEADAYWETRHPESRVGAWASRQSEPLDSRETLLARVVEHHGRFGDRPAPRPPFWSGFRIVPDRIEFWKSGKYRLHERLCYERGAGGWTSTLLNP